MKINCPKCCGDCCKVIILCNYKNISKVRWWKKNRSNNLWELTNLKRISFRKAVKLNPALAIYKHYTRRHIDYSMEYFICRNFDYQTNKCKAYSGNRPYMCTDFPYYNHSVLDASHFYHLPNCYFTNQIMKYELTNKQQEVLKLSELKRIENEKIPNRSIQEPGH